MQKGPVSQALSFRGIQVATSQLCLGLSSFSDLWEPNFGPLSLPLILTPGFCPPGLHKLSASACGVL